MRFCWAFSDCIGGAVSERYLASGLLSASSWLTAAIALWRPACFSTTAASHKDSVPPPPSLLLRPTVKPCRKHSHHDIMCVACSSSNCLYLLFLPFPNEDRVAHIQACCISEQWYKKYWAQRSSFSDRKFLKLSQIESATVQYTILHT